MSNDTRRDGALVTGASSGIGEATARALAAHGAAVALVARRADRLEELAGASGAAGARSRSRPTWPTSEQAIGAVERTVAELGRLDIVINNAGVMLLGPIEDAPTEEWDRMVSVNVDGLLYVAHAALPHLLEAGAGRAAPGRRPRERLVGRRPPRARGGGSTTHQAGVGAFTEALRQEVTERHVRVSWSSPAPSPPSWSTNPRPRCANDAPRLRGRAAGGRGHRRRDRPPSSRGRGASRSTRC